MAELLLLRMPPAGEETASWLTANAQGVALTAVQSGSLSAAAEVAAGRRVCVLVDGSDVLLAEVELPLRGGARLAQVAAYALEEQLAGDIEQQHFAVGRRGEGTARTPVAVVDKSLLRGWLGQLELAAIEPESMFAESSLLPVNPGQTVGMLDRGQLYVLPVAGSAPPAVLPAEDLAASFGAALQGRAPGDEHLLLYVSAAEWRSRQEQFEQLRGMLGSLNVQVLNGGPLPWLALQLGERNAINLLQGEFAHRTSAGAEWPRWRMAAGLAAAALLCSAGSQWYLRARLHSIETRLDQQLQELSARYFAGQPAAGELRHAAEQRLLGGGGSSGFLPAIEAVSRAGAGGGLSIKSLNFGDHALRLHVQAPTIERVDQFSQALQRAGWKSDPPTVNPRGDAIEGELRIKAGS